MDTLYCTKECMGQMLYGVLAQSYHGEDWLDMPTEDVVSREHNCFVVAVAEEAGCTMVEVVAVGIYWEVAAVEFVADEEVAAEYADEEQIVVVRQSVEEVEPRIEHCYCLE